MELKNIRARKIFNSRGEETIEIQVNDGVGSFPIGLSKGRHEVQPFPKDSIDLAIKRFNEIIAEEFKGYEFFGFEDLETIEEKFFELGGFDLFGGASLLAFEYALLDALSKRLKEPLFKILNENVKEVISRPLGNVIGGGVHSRNLGPDIQEFLVYNEAKSVYDAIKINIEFHKKICIWLKERDKNFLGSKNDEGAWVTSLNTKEILDLLLEFKYVFESEYGVEVKLGLDIAANTLYKDGRYVYRKDKLELSREEQIEHVIDIVKLYDIFYVEDPLYEEDFEGFSKIKSSVGALVVGDDLITTNIERLEKAIKYNSINGVIIKPNQICSLVQVKEMIDLCKSKEITPILSHRSGETEHNILAHLAVAWEIPIVKFGIVGGERVSKLNELIRIEEYLKNFK